VEELMAHVRVGARVALSTEYVQQALGYLDEVLLGLRGEIVQIDETARECDYAVVEWETPGVFADMLEELNEDGLDVEWLTLEQEEPMPATKASETDRSDAGRLREMHARLNAWFLANVDRVGLNIDGGPIASIEFAIYRLDTTGEDGNSLLQCGYTEKFEDPGF
jgi:hypothetical protein